MSLLVDETQLAVQIDPSAVYDAILDPRIAPSFTRTVTVTVLGSAFEEPGLQVIEVDFIEGDGVLVYRPAEATPRPGVVQGQAPAHLRPPIKQFLLPETGQPGSEVTYRVRAIRTGKRGPWSEPMTDEVIGGELLVTEIPPS